jgi:hypothetical protein
MQRRFRRRHGYGTRLHCNNLAERLLLESRIVRGSFRLGNEMIMFILLLLALGFQGDPSVRRGVYTDMSTSFDFEGILDMDIKQQFVGELSTISQTSKQFFLVSGAIS